VAGGRKSGALFGINGTLMTLIVLIFADKYLRLSAKSVSSAFYF
jgi:hypothetical protein